MKKWTYLFFMLCSIHGITQDNWCGTDTKLQAAYDANPNLKQSITEHMERMHQVGVSSDRTDSTIIPVVFHVIHDNGIGDVSHAQIMDAMRMLNEDFNRLNADTVDTRNTANAPFVPVAVDAKICFRLAKIDPNGNCTDGVERRNSAAGTYDGNDARSKSYSGGGLDAWDRSKYFNIWVINSIESGGGGTTLGYAQFPYFGSADTYGIMIRHDRLGTIGTAVSADRTLTHEVGHCFGLFHTFQDGCGSNNSDCTNQGDYCCDTPPVDQAHWSCGLTQNFCNQIPNNDHYGFDAYDQFENYMSYSPCQNMFSADQKNVMDYNFDTYPWLANLSSAGNLLATGVSLPSTLCEAKFSASETMVCEGSTITFADLSHSGITGRTWNFAGGSPATSSDSVVAVSYNTPGNYAVSIDVTDGNTNLVETKTDYITVLPGTGESLPIIEGFENISFPDNVKYFSTASSGSSDWQLSSNASAPGTKSIFYDNFANGSEGAVVSFESSTIDLGILDPTENLIFTFDYAYKKRSPSDDEWLRIFVSDDCGESWALRKIIHGSTLNNLSTGVSYLPSEEDWRNVSITNVVSSYFVSNFRYRFVFESDGGNNIFIDNINIYPESSLNIDNISGENLRIYPNPAKHILNVEIGELNVESYLITNASGQIIQQVNQPITDDNRVLSVQTQNISRGIYYLTLINQTQTITKKFIKQ